MLQLLILLAGLAGAYWLVGAHPLESKREAKVLAVGALLLAFVVGGLVGTAQDANASERCGGPDFPCSPAAQHEKHGTGSDVRNDPAWRACGSGAATGATYGLRSGYVFGVPAGLLGGCGVGVGGYHWHNP